MESMDDIEGFEVDLVEFFGEESFKCCVASFGSHDAPL